MAKKKSTKKEDKKEKKEEVKEIITIKKNGKEQTKEFSGKTEKKHASKEEIKKQKKQLRSIFLFLGIFILIFAIVWLIGYGSSHFKYETLKFTKIKQGQLTFYQIPMITQYQGSKLTTVFYLRTNPEKLKEIPFEGEMNLRNNMILNVTTENLYCDGDWQIAIGNLMNLDIFNIQVSKNENASCGGNYMYVNIHEGNESKIEQYGEYCYNLYIANCEVLPVTEKFMVEAFVDLKEIADNYSWN